MRCINSNLYFIMTKSEILKAIAGKKIAVPEEASVNFANALGVLEIPRMGKGNHYYFSESEGEQMIAEAISDRVFKAMVEVDEIGIEDLTKEIFGTECKYESGQILIAVRENKDNLAFMFVHPAKDGKTLVGYGMDSENEFSATPLRYTESICRKANAAEKSKFLKAVKAAGYKLIINDEKKLIYPKSLRVPGGTYYTVLCNIKENTLMVVEMVDCFDDIDDINYDAGNYFTDREEAEEAMKKFTI